MNQIRNKNIMAAALKNIMAAAIINIFDGKWIFEASFEALQIT